MYCFKCHCCPHMVKLFHLSTPCTLVQALCTLFLHPNTLSFLYHPVAQQTSGSSIQSASAAWESPQTPLPSWPSISLSKTLFPSMPLLVPSSGRGMSTAHLDPIAASAPSLIPVTQVPPGGRCDPFETRIWASLQLFLQIIPKALTVPAEVQISYHGWRSLSLPFAPMSIPTDPVFQSSWTPLPQAPAFHQHSMTLNVFVLLFALGRSLLLMRSLPSGPACLSLASLLHWVAGDSHLCSLTDFENDNTVCCQTPPPDSLKMGTGSSVLRTVPSTWQGYRSPWRDSYPQGTLEAATHTSNKNCLSLPSVALHNIFLQL